jgi:bla regulator protein BlaR1
MTTQFIINHLWQSSCFVVLAAVLALLLRKNSAKVRHWLWLSASLKFLLPLVALVRLGSKIPWPTQGPVSIPAPVFTNTLAQIAEPLAPHSYAAYSAVLPPAPMHWVPIALGMVWALGFVAIMLVRCRSWFLIRAALRASVPIELPVPIPAFIAPGAEEPGIVGFLRPVLVLPPTLLEHLTPRQLGAVLAHELCHVRRRDNLFAAIHMVVEAIFWFHPLVWWIGSRMVEERELACDEEVLRMGCEPTDYVEGILKVCRLYTESPLRCVSGVTGADVKKRLRAILAGNTARELTLGRKTVLAAIGLATFAGPLVLGMLSAPQARAQSEIESPRPVLPPGQSEVVGPLVAQVAPARETGQGAKQGQPAIAEPIQFEVTSVKPLDPGAACCSPPQIDPVRFVYKTTLDNLIGQAYRAYFPCPTTIDDSGHCAFPGAPAWIFKDHFLVEATLPKGLPAYSRNEFMGGRAPQLNQMLRVLLEDRFKLKVHWESRTMPVYALTVTKKGPKLTPSAGPAERPMSLTTRKSNGNFHSTFKYVDTSMQDFAAEWGDFLDHPVIDRTDLKGNFDFTLEWESEPDEPSNNGTGMIASRLHLGPSMFTALEENLGLKLEATKAPVEVLVIDHVEQPSSN